MADFTTSATLLLGVKRAQKHANEEYPFGYGREVFFWVLISAMFMLVVTGGASMYFGINRGSWNLRRSTVAGSRL